MFLKLYKYDFLDVIKKIVFYYIALIAIAIFSKVFDMIFTNTSYAFIASIPKMFYFLCLSLGIIFSIILCMVRYYKNMLSDQGYLTHTLPVKKSTILLSKILVTLTIEVITLLIMFISLLISSFGSISFIMEMLMSLISAIDPEYIGSVVGIAILIILLIIASAVFQVTQVSLCLTLGATHNKNKLVLAFVYYMAINFVLQIISSIGILIMVAIISHSKITISIGHFYLFLAMAIIFTILGVVASYFVNLLFLKKKLNLE